MDSVSLTDISMKLTNYVRTEKLPPALEIICESRCMAEMYMPRGGGTGIPVIYYIHKKKIGPTECLESKGSKYVNFVKDHEEIKVYYNAHY